MEGLQSERLSVSPSMGGFESERLSVSPSFQFHEDSIGPRPSMLEQPQPIHITLGPFASYLVLHPTLVFSANDNIEDSARRLDLFDFSDVKSVAISRDSYEPATAFHCQLLLALFAERGLQLDQLLCEEPHMSQVLFGSGLSFESISQLTLTLSASDMESDSRYGEQLVNGLRALNALSALSLRIDISRKRPLLGGSSRLYSLLAEILGDFPCRIPFSTPWIKSQMHETSCLFCC